MQAGDVRARDAFYLDGAWVPAVSRAPIPVVDPSTEQEVASVPAGARRTSTWRSPRPAPWEYGLEEFPEAKSLQL